MEEIRLQQLTAAEILKHMYPTINSYNINEKYQSKNPHNFQKPEIVEKKGEER